jgi:fatty acid desaturase
MLRERIHPHRPQTVGRTIVTLATVLWIVAVILVIAGIFAIIRKQVIWGVVLIVVGLLVGPGGVSIFT